MRDVFVLDACALIAFLRDEKGADVVGDIYDKACTGDLILVINKINLLEIYYDFYRSRGAKYANDQLENIKRSEIIIYEFTDKAFLEAGRLKATYKISLADSIALAQAVISKGTLLTADHHEFDVIEESKQVNVSFRWIR